MEKVSVVIPVLRESSMLESLIRRFLRDSYENKEIIVSIEEPTEASKKLHSTFKNDVKFLFHKKRMGKAMNLNRAAKTAGGDILFFCDSDNKISGRSNDTLAKLVEGMDGYDLADFKADSIRESFLSRMASLEFLNYNFYNVMCSNYMGRKPFFMGFAFAIRKEAFFDIKGFRKCISEDLDLCWRAFRSGKTHVNIQDIMVSTKAPGNFKEWFSQRYRWAIGLWQFSTGNIRPIASTLKSHPKVIAPPLILGWPLFILFIMGMLMSESAFESSLLLAIALMPIKFIDVTPFAFLLLSGVVFVKSALLYVLAFGISLSMNYVLSRKLNFHFSVKDFVVYYLFYSHLMVFIYIYGLFMMKVSKNFKAPEWKF